MKQVLAGNFGKRLRVALPIENQLGLANPLSVGDLDSVKLILNKFEVD